MPGLNFGWSEGTIGEFERLSFWAQKNRQLAQEMADTSGAGLITRVVAAGTLQLRDLAAAGSPVDTGTLRSAHRAEIEPYGGGVQGLVIIDPYARNPVSHTKPDYYGEIWAQKYYNWFEHTADWHGDSVLDRMEQTINDRVDDLWQLV